MGLRLGTSICAPHICQHSGAEVSAQGLHGLSYSSSEGQHIMRLSALNDIIYCSLSGQATTAAGCVAAHAEEKKCKKYSHLVPNYIVQPVAMETSGVIGCTF